MGAIARADTRREEHAGVSADAAKQGGAGEEEGAAAAAVAATGREDAAGGGGRCDVGRRWWQWRWRWEMGARVRVEAQLARAGADADAAKGVRAAMRPLDWRIRAAIGRLRVLTSGYAPRAAGPPATMGVSW